MTILDRIAAWFGYTRREYPRINMGADAIARGMRWEQFYSEEGGIADMIVSVRRDYFEAYAALSISDRDKQYEYALADRLAREFDRKVRTVIETGKIKTREQSFADQNTALRR